MPKNWKAYKLSDTLNIIGGGTPKTSIPEYWDGDIPWLSVKDFQGEKKIVSETEKSITELGLGKSSTKLLPKGAMIISARGTVGELAVLGRQMAFNQSCYGLMPNEKTNRDFLYYLVKQKIRELQGLSYGSVFDTITTKTFDGLYVQLPPLPEQKAIAKILSTIDDKIENNLAINKTLEDMAMALYKHWFVDFGPFQDGEFIDSELGPIPKGWEVKNLDELGNMYYGKMPKKDKIQKGGYPLYSGYKIVGHYPDYNCQKDKVIVVARGVGGTGDIKMTKEDLFLTNISICIENNLGLLSDIILYYKLKSTGLHYLRTGSAQPQITINDLKGVSLIIPPKEIQTQFLDVFNNIIEKKDNNITENKSLKNLRDTMLPRLISGKVRLKEFKEQVEQII